MFERKNNIISQQFMRFFFPTVLMTMALSLSVVVDGIIVGNFVGPDALAAVNLVLPVTLVFNAVYALIGVGGSTMYSVALGERQKQRAKQLFTVAVISMTCIALVLGAVGLALCRPIAELLTVNAQNLTQLVYDYIKFVMLTSPLLVIVPGLVYFIRAVGKVKLASSILIIANVVNLLMDLFYIGVLKAGIGGAAVATGTGYFIGLLVAIFGLTKAKDLRFCKLPADTIKTLGGISKMGLPSTINTCLTFLRLTCINAIVTVYLGSDGVTAFSVCTSCLSIVAMFVGGSAQTMMPLLGTLRGEKEFTGIEFTIKKAITITGSATLILLLVFELMPAQITGLFGVTDPTQVAIAVEAIRIYAISLPFMGMLYIAMCVYQVLGHQNISSILAVLEGFAIVVPAAWLMASIFGQVGIWAAFPVGEIGTMLVILMIVQLTKKKNPKAKGVFLIEKDLPEAMLDVTMIRTEEQAAQLSQSVIEFCGEQGLSSVTSGVVGVALEEMTVNTIERTKSSKSHYIDVKLMVKDQEVVIIFKDNGRPFNPLENKEDQDQFDNISVAVSIADKVTYDYILGMNCSTVIIKVRGED